MEGSAARVALGTRFSSSRLQRELRRARRLAPVLAVAALLALVIGWPLVTLAASAFRTAPLGQPGQWTLESLSALSSPLIQQAIVNSLVLAAASTVIGGALASALAFIAERTDARLRSWVTPLMVITFATPQLFYAIGYSLLANPFTGLANSLLDAVLPSYGPRLNVESWGGLLMVVSFRAAAFMYLFLAAGFRSLGSVLDEASYTAGYGRVATFFRIDLPLLAPAISGGAILSFAAALQAFDVALIIGDPAGIQVISPTIYDLLVRTSPPAYGKAGLLSLLLVATIAALVLTQERLLARRGFATIGGKGVRQSVVKLGAKRAAFDGLIACYALLALVLPFAAIVTSSFQPFPGVLGAPTLVHYERVLARADTYAAASNTALLAFSVAAAVMTLAVVVDRIGRRSAGRAGTAIRLAMVLPFSMPGFVAALAVTAAYVSVPGLRSLYGTVWLLGIGLVVITVPFASQIARAAREQIAGDLEEAARVAGAGPAKSFADVTGRLMAPAIVSGLVFVAIVVAGNLDIPLMLGTPGLGTLSVQIFVAHSQGYIADGAALFVLLLCAIFAIMAVLKLVQWSITRFVVRRRQASIKFLAQRFVDAGD